MKEAISQHIHHNFEARAHLNDGVGQLRRTEALADIVRLLLASCNHKDSRTAAELRHPTVWLRCPPCLPPDARAHVRLCTKHAHKHLTACLILVSTSFFFHPLRTHMVRCNIHSRSSLATGVKHWGESRQKQMHAKCLVMTVTDCGKCQPIFTFFPFLSFFFSIHCFDVAYCPQ